MDESPSVVIVLYFPAQPTVKILEQRLRLIGCRAVDSFPHGGFWLIHQELVKVAWCMAVLGADLGWRVGMDSFVLTVTLYALLFFGSYLHICRISMLTTRTKGHH